MFTVLLFIRILVLIIPLMRLLNLEIYNLVTVFYRFDKYMILSTRYLAILLSEHFYKNAFLYANYKNDETH